MDQKIAIAGVVVAIIFGIPAYIALFPEDKNEETRAVLRQDIAALEKHLKATWVPELNSVISDQGGCDHVDILLKALGGRVNGVTDDVRARLCEQPNIDKILPRQLKKCAPAVDMTEQQLEKFKQVISLAEQKLSLTRNQIVGDDGLAAKIDYTRSKFIENVNTIDAYRPPPRGVTKTRLEQSLLVCGMRDGVSVFRQLLSECLLAGLDQVDKLGSFSESEKCRDATAQWHGLAARLSGFGSAANR